jgi:exopolysaccharide biosynthesis operon protein EpsL
MPWTPDRRSKGQQWETIILFGLPKWQRLLQGSIGPCRRAATGGSGKLRLESVIYDLRVLPASEVGSRGKEAILHRIDSEKVTIAHVCNWTVSGAIFAIFSIGYAERSVAAPGDAANQLQEPIDFYVGDQESYDSNLYRLPSFVTDVSTVVAPHATREDYINTAYVGFDGQWTPGQQIIGLNLRVNDNRFAHNDVLNNYSGSANLAWNWRFGSYLSGQVGGDYARALANFGETLFLGRDMVDSTDYFGNARYQVGPRFAIYGGVRGTDSTHNAVAAQYNDYRSTSGNAGIEYVTSVDRTIGVEYRYTDGRINQGNFLLNGAPFNRNFSQNTINGLLNYVISDKTTLNVSAGYLRRAYTTESVGAFTGDIWNVSLQWQPTEKTQIVFSVSRQLQAYLASESDYFVATGGSVAPVWAATDKLTFKLTASYAQQNYIGTSPSVLTIGAPRHDNINSEQATIVYVPIRALTFNFSYYYQQRGSNQAEFKYDDKQAIVSGTFKFK